MTACPAGARGLPAAALPWQLASVNKAVTRLCDLGVVSQVGASGKDRLFAAAEVMSLFESPPRLNATA
jgi:hypothetical protein